ncbi:MAG: Threonylcarbamoyladenosine tRNA methylthiotransferase MtaB [Microgenomates group bacterium ADurb.Bin219]|nr:MAG: Threonylcarbamoyladenosine tRNA methylthiotransferase MtaB [Microgenomates group bacterium ADurb.Bin219]
MKVILTRPSYKTHLITPPLGIGYLSSYLKKQKIDCRIIDGLNLNLTNRQLANQCRSADIVGISVLSYYFLQAIDLSKKLKKMGKIVIIGGPHPSCLPELTLKETKADFVIKGEGEEVFSQLVKEIESGKINRKEKIRSGPFIKDLSSLPFPDWEQIDPRIYQKAPHGGVVKAFPVAPILTTRGCPYECKFCASPKLWQRTIRYRRPAEVVKEIKYLVDRFGVKEIHFEDDNFTLKRAHAEKVCRLLIKEKIKVAWATPNGIRADKVDLSLLKLMKKAGCYFVAFGIESGNQTILNNVAKHSNLAVIRKAVKLAHQAGLITQGFFIFGLPGETKETVRETIDFAKSLPLDKAQFLMLDIIPGSALWEELKFGKKVNWQLDSFHEISWLPPTIKREDLDRAQSLAFREFFLNPARIMKMLSLIKLSQLKYILRRAKDFGIVKK